MAACVGAFAVMRRDAGRDAFRVVHHRRRARRGHRAPFVAALVFTFTSGVALVFTSGVTFIVALGVTFIVAFVFTLGVMNVVPAGV
ncbi:hypothetical protein BE08_21120 [Sorangium cellulosum]|uniref:Uncharacterized protein n=1 Tax=Sorangium cellulosum TaxID=56 RepID=A0A150PHA2_SORCE|nr:hypothetical protein BE08_21120 [Sorangium cellulosum]